MKADQRPKSSIDWPARLWNALKATVRQWSLLAHLIGRTARGVQNWATRARRAGTFLGQMARVKRDLLRRTPRTRVPGLVVSLTTYPARAKWMWLTIDSILAQSLQPERIVIVLSRDEFRGVALPRSLKKRLERQCSALWIEERLGPFGKLVPTTRLYPEATIVTVDDDIAYPRDLLRRFIEASTNTPDAIICGRGRVVQFEPSGSFAPYSAWDHAGRTTPAPYVFPLGVNGVLYPPQWFGHAPLLDSDAALRLSPKNDDVWFWACACIARTRTVCLGDGILPVNAALDGSPALFDENRTGGNDRQLREVAEALALREFLGPST